MSDCTHDHIEWGKCAGCGDRIDRDPDEIEFLDLTSVRSLHGCQGRGWFHDGSEREAARVEGRSPRPCPDCT